MSTSEIGPAAGPAGDFYRKPGIMIPSCRVYPRAVVCPAAIPPLAE